MRCRVQVFGLLLGAMALSSACSESAGGITDAPDAAATAPAQQQPQGSESAPAPNGTPPAGSSTAPGGTGPGPGSTVADITNTIQAYDAAIAKAICAKLSECCSSTDYALYFDGYKSKPFDLTAPPPPAQCEATLATQLGKLHGKWATSVTLGRINYVPARAAKCITDFNAATCGPTFLKTLGNPACLSARDNEVFVKVAPTGAACTDIADGSFYGECDPKFGYCGSDKRCNAWQTKDQPCSITPTRLFCAPDLTCLNPTPSKPGKCSGPSLARQLGDTCGSSSGPMQICVAGTFCNWDTGVCEAQKPDGASCKFDDECTSERAYTCMPFGAGTCGQVFCGGTK